MSFLSHQESPTTQEIEKKENKQSKPGDCSYYTADNFWCVRIAAEFDPEACVSLVDGAEVVLVAVGV